MVDKSKQYELEELRKTDETAFICVTCGEIKTGWGARIGIGWTCSGDCYDTECRRIWKLEGLDENGYKIES